MKMGLPTPMLANRSVKAWIKASDKLGIMGVKIDDARMRDYVVILDETTYGSISTRSQFAHLLTYRDFVPRCGAWGTPQRARVM